MFKVIKTFKDAQDNDYLYHRGDTFPHDDKEVSEERIEELASNKNRRGMALIEEVKPKKRNKKDAE